jgi:hypothetical protein
MKFINNPFDILTEIIQENYPDVDCDIYIGEQLTDGKETFGCTLFPEEEGERIAIEVHYTMSLNDTVEIIAHELAHVIAGIEAEHGEEWERVFDDIHVKYQQKLDERFTA